MAKSEEYGDLDGAEFETLAVRAGTLRSGEAEHSESIYVSSSYLFESAAHAAALSGECAGNVYSRYTNPGVAMFERRLAALEGGEQAVAMASGMAAILGVAMTVLKAGDHVLVSRSVFGTTTSLFGRYMTRFGVEVDFVSLLDVEGWRRGIRPNTRLLFLETPSNPLCEIADIEEMAALAHEKNCLLVVDNCFCTPALQRPLSLGADIVVHSATKYLDGQGRCLGGACVGSRELMEELVVFLRTCGATMSPFNAWVFHKSLETLSIRMRAHSENALQLAQWLTGQPAVEQVYYPGLPSHPGHEVARRQQSGFGGVLSFRVRGGREAAWRVIDETRIMSLTANLGDARTTIVHPATTTHGRLSAQERQLAGIDDALIRVAVGLESVADLQRDLARGMADG